MVRRCAGRGRGGMDRKIGAPVGVVSAVCARTAFFFFVRRDSLVFSGFALLPWTERKAGKALVFFGLGCMQHSAAPCARANFDFCGGTCY